MGVQGASTTVVEREASEDGEAGSAHVDMVGPSFFLWPKE